ncbi:sigma-70 family RNA polymerase sigma factor [Roseiterribacter gracilis]|uniref:RNA polymerase sigma factor n=1 Tax=Roseiterribacter gracilis TaxID=2812848 RepID=A0A8S8XDI3_9PROT|nr:RNA polymerase sigma factor [Rhodospirillales bacterium TMPK1]
MPATLRLVASDDTGDEGLADLLAACARGDRAALQRLYEATAPATFGRMLRLLRDRALAEDALHDVYLAVWRKAGQFDPTRGSAPGWIAAIARNRALDIIKSRRRDAPIEEAGDPEQWFDAVPAPDMALVTQQDVAALRACLEQLSPTARAMVQRAFFEGLSHAEVATVAEQPLGTIKSTIRRALIALRACLEP